MDEIGDIPLAVQVKLLRLLQEMSFQRLGGNETIRVDVRVVCATNRNLESAIKQGAFREDLYHRLDVVTIPLPPLRERRDDIPNLVAYFLNRHSKELGISKPPIAADAVELLQKQAWPGNVRELEHLLQRVLIFNRGYTIQAADLAPAMRHEDATDRPDSDANDERCWQELIREYLSAHGGSRVHEQLLELVERLLLSEALNRSKGNQTHAAKLLGLPRPTLSAKLQRYGLREPADGATGGT